MAKAKNEPKRRPSDDDELPRAKSAVKDWFDEDVGDVDPSLPLLADELYEVELAHPVETVKSNDGLKDLALIKVKTCEAARDIEDKPLNKGYPLNHRITLTPGGNLDEDGIKRNIAAVVQAFGVRKLGQLKVGDRCYVKTRVRKERTDEKTGQTYPPSVEIRLWRKVKDRDE